MQSTSWRVRQKTPQLGRYCQEFEWFSANSQCLFRLLCVCEVCRRVVPLRVFKLQPKLLETLATDNLCFYAECLLECLSCSVLTEEKRIVDLLRHSAPNWALVLDFNLSPVHSAPTKHNTASGSFQCKPGKQLWMKVGEGLRCLSISIP